MSAVVIVVFSMLVAQVPVYWWGTHREPSILMGCLLAVLTYLFTMVWLHFVPAWWSL